VTVGDIDGEHRHDFGDIGHEPGVRELSDPFSTRERRDPVDEFLVLDAFVEQRHHELVVDGEFPDEFRINVPQNFLVRGDVEGIGLDLLCEVDDDFEGETEFTPVRNHVVAYQFGLEHRRMMRLITYPSSTGGVFLSR